MAAHSGADTPSVPVFCAAPGRSRRTCEASSGVPTLAAVVLRAAVEVEVADGLRRTFGPGDLLRAEDSDGIGHVTMSAGIRR
jgi:hypothetical protein